MSNLGPQQQNQSYEGLLQIPGGVTRQLQQVQDGEGNGTGLWLSTTGSNATTPDSFAASVNGATIPNVVPRLISDGFGDYVSVKDFGAIGDGVTDDTAAIQAAMTYLGSVGGGKITFPMPSVSYYFREISVLSNTIIDLAGSPCKLKPGKAGAYHAFFVVMGNNVTIENGVFDGNYSAQSADPSNIDRYAAIYSIAASNLTIKNNYISNTYGNAYVRMIDGSDVLVCENYIECSASVAQGAIFYSVGGSLSNYRVKLNSNSTKNGGIAINDDLAAQHLWEWQISNNSITNIDIYNVTASVGARASDGIISNNNIRGGYFGITASVGGSYAKSILNIIGNVVESTYNGSYGIEHYGVDVNVCGNILTNCGIVSSVGTDGNVNIASNLFRFTLATSYNWKAIAFGLGTYNNINICGNSAYGVGTFVGFSATVSNTITCTGNTSTVAAGVADGQFFEWVTNSATPVAVGSICISGNTINNAARGFVYFAGLSTGAVTVSSLKVAGNSPDSTSLGITTYNATIDSSCIYADDNEPTTQFPVFGSTIATNAVRFNSFVVNATGTGAFTLSAPIGGYSGKRITFTIKNTSGTSLGTATWDSVFKLATWVQPGNGASRSITFEYNGTNWVEINRTSADVPN
jgi:hypothetical protein